MDEFGIPHIRDALPQGGLGDAIVVRDLSRRFGSVPALSNMSLTVPYGKVTGLVGPNGAGKTTLLLVLATLLAQDSGHVRIAGFDPARDPDLVRAKLGWMPDTLGVYEQLTVAEYLVFFARAHGMNRDAAGHRAAELLQLLALRPWAESPVHVLSRGQKQRLALGRSMVHNPSVLLLDEPASGLDPRSRVELRDLLRNLASNGAAVLISSHILTELEEIADQVVFVSKGRTVGRRELATLAARNPVRWRVRATNLDVLTEALAERDISEVSRTPAGVVELPAMTENEAADLLTWLVCQQVRVVSFAPASSHLESAYLSMTEERL